MKNGMMAIIVMIPLRCCVKKYEWGKRGMDSIVARLVKNQLASYEVDPDSPFAEYWMGTHPSGPTVVVNGDNDSMKLKDLLAQYPEYVGNIKMIEKYGKDIPFLFKVLSVGKALSIQAHPDKELAEELFETDPAHYPDPNHKPELAIALTDFEALCGFRPTSEIESFIDNIPEFRAVIGAEAIANFKNAQNKTKHVLKPFFTSFMGATDEVVSQNLQALVERWKNEESTDPEKEVLRQLLLRLYSSFPNDIGCFAIFFFNYLTLKPGEAIYIGPDEPHAYILGDCIECMACSDNVVRAGLTPKFKDVKTLCGMLTYKSKSAKEQLLTPKVIDQFTKTYVAPVPEFDVDAIEVTGENVRPSFEYKLEPKESGSIILVIKGECQCQETTISHGYVGFIPAMTSLTINHLKSDLLIYRAHCRVE